MVLGPRDFTPATRMALGALSQGHCYFPGCDARVVKFVGDESLGILDEPSIDVHIAHICDANPGNRYDGQMTDDERRNFKNLILLCKPHHDLVDKKHPEKYSAGLLRQWKADREQGRGGSPSQVAGDDVLEAIERDQFEKRLSLLVANDGGDLKDLTAALGAAVRVMPLSDGAFARRLTQVVEDASWSRDPQEWHFIREEFLARLRLVREFSEEFHDVQGHATASVAKFDRVEQFSATPSLQQFMRDIYKPGMFVEEIVSSIAGVVLDRLIAATLLPLAAGKSVKTPWQQNGGAYSLEQIWSGVSGNDQALHTLEVFEENQISFRVTLTTRTIDLFGADRGMAYPTPLSVELVDPWAWWLVLVPVAGAALIHGARIRMQRGKDTGALKPVIRKLCDLKYWAVGLP